MMDFLSRSFMIAPEGTTKPRHCLLRCAMRLPLAAGMPVM